MAARKRTTAAKSGSTKSTAAKSGTKYAGKPDLTAKTAAKPAPRKSTKPAPRAAAPSRRPTVVTLWSGAADSTLRRLGANTEHAGDSTELAAAIRYADALLLTGGGDVDPLRYREDAGAGVYGVNPERDAFEIDAVRWAVRLGIPLFGICRGNQVINVALGGSLYQDLPSMGKHGHGYGEHAVKIDKGSRFASWAGTHVAAATTLHHQAVRTPGRGMVAVGHALDGTIEVTESEARHLPLIIGTQFHPEIDARSPKGEGGYALDVFGGFIDAL